METVKACMLASVEEVVTDERTRRSISDSIKKIPIADSTNMRRVEALDCIGRFRDAFGQTAKG